MTDAERDALLASALRYSGGSHEVGDVVAGIAEGRFQEWRGERSVVVTELVANPRVKEAHAFLAAGDLDEIKVLYPVMLAWAKSLGCTRATMTGRPGWAKTFLTRDEGWTSQLVLFSKEI